MTETIVRTPAAEAARPVKAWKPRPDGLGTALTLAAAWVLLIVASAVNRPDFLSHQVLLSITFTMSIVGVLAVGEGLVAISGGILDLSLPMALILPAWVITTMLGRGWNSWLVVVVAVAVGAGWGLVNALVIVFAKLNPIIVTLGTNFAGIAVMLLIFQSAQTPLSSGFSKFGQGYFLGLPNIFWPMLALVLVADFLIRTTRYGRRIVGVGGNPVAAKARGISLRKTRFGVFMGAGACGGLAAVLFTASTPGFTAIDGATYLLPVIAAVILAGVSLGGGRGRLWIILLSVGLLATVPTSLVFFGLSSSWQIVIQGAILIVAVSLDGFQQKRAAR